MAAFDYTSSFAGINNALANIGKQNDIAYQRQSLANLGQKALGGDYNAAAQAAFAAGDAGTGLGLLKLGQVQKQESDWLKANPGILGGAVPSVAAPGSTAPVAGPASLIQNESGGNWKAQNDAVGAGGAVGHFGRLQFGQARIQDAINAGAIPAGTTPQAFIESPELQKRAEAWHFADIDQKIQQNGFDKLIGQSINGVPITIDGLRAVAHLGGTEGMRKFVESGGRYNPADRNGTRLSDYFARHGGGGSVGQPQPVQVAENEADVARIESQMPGYGGAQPAQVAQAAPQPGAPIADAPAPGAVNAQGFAIPGGDAVSQSIANDPRVMNLQRALAGAPDRFKPSIQSRLNILVEELKAQRQQSAPTDVQKNYELARRQGYQGSLLDYQKELRAQTNVNVDTGPKLESAYASSNGKAISDRFSKIVEEGDAANAEVGTLARIRELGGQIKNIGSGAALQGWLAERGIKVGPNVSEIEAYSALIDKLTPQQRIAGAGATSDYDARMFKNSLPGLMRTQGGNELILSTLEALNTYKRQRGDIVAEAMANNEKPPEVLKRLKELPDPFAGFKEAAKGEFKNAPPPQASASPARPDGSSPPQPPPIQGSKQAPDGNWYLPDPNRPGKYLQVQ